MGMRDGEMGRVRVGEGRRPGLGTEGNTPGCRREPRLCREQKRAETRNAVFPVVGEGLALICIALISKNI